MMKKLLITAGGTATAWHISNVVQQYFKDQIDLYISDTNDPNLVPASVIAHKSFIVPLATDSKYEEVIRKIIVDNRIECVIPLIPQEAYLFASNGDFISSHSIKSLAPVIETTSKLTDKAKLYQTLSDLHIPTPRIFTLRDINDNDIYIIKPRLGFGSLGIKCALGTEIKKEVDNIKFDEIVLQEYCHESDYDEVTVEIYNGSAGLHCFARRRIATKAGVCIKTEPVDERIFYPYIKKLVEKIDCPLAFNVQFLRHKGEWKLFDCNLRLGAGTSLSTAIGFQLTRSLLADVCGVPVEKEWLSYDKEIKKVLRVYQEIVIR